MTYSEHELEFTFAKNSLVSYIKYVSSKCYRITANEMNYGNAVMVMAKNIDTCIGKVRMVMTMSKTAVSG